MIAVGLSEDRRSGLRLAVQTIRTWLVTQGERLIYEQTFEEARIVTVYDEDGARWVDLWLTTPGDQVDVVCHHKAVVTVTGLMPYTNLGATLAWLHEQY